MKNALTFLKTKFRSLVSDKRFSEILTGSAWAIFARIFAASLAMISSIITARYYGAGVMGIVATISSFLTLTTILTVLGTNTSILRLIPEHLSKYSATSAFRIYRKTQYCVAAISVITGSLLFWSSNFIAVNLFSKSYLSFYFAIGAAFIVFKSLATLNTQAVRGLRLILVFAFMQTLPSVSQLIILIAATLFLFNQGNPLYAMLISLAITALTGAAIMDRKFRHIITTEDVVHPTPIKNILSLSVPMLMTSTINLVMAQTGVIILGMFRSDAEVGYYSVAVRLATMTTFVLSGINSISAPTFSELFHTGKMSDLFYVARKSTKLIFWTTVPVLLFLILLGKPLLRLFYGDDFIVAYVAILFLAIGQFVSSISGSTGVFMNMTGHQKALFYIKFLTASGNIILCLMLVPHYGIYGASFSAMVSLISLNLLILFYIKRNYGKMIGYMPSFRFITNRPPKSTDPSG